MSTESTTTLLTMVDRMTDNAAEVYRAANSQSLIEYTQTTRNEFLTLIESNLIDVPFISAVCQSVQSIVAGYYLSSVGLAMEISGINVTKTLGKLNPNRDPIESVLGSTGFKSVSGGLASKILGLESFEQPHLPSFKRGLPAPSVGLEAIAVEAFTKEEKEAIAAGRANARADVTTGGFGRDAGATTKELSNLSVGKMYDIEFKNNGNCITIPASIRLMVTDTDTMSMINILGAASEDYSFSSRFKRWWSGDKQINFVGDLLLCNDIHEEFRRKRIQDRSKFFEHMMRKNGSNYLAGLFSGNPSVNNASAVIIVSSTTAAKVEVALGGPFSDFATRQRVFEVTAAMLIVVVDRQWENVVIYHRSIETYSNLQARELSKGFSGSSDNIEDMIRAYSAGAAPKS